MSIPVISIENLGKKYTISHERQGEQRYRRLSEELVEAIKRPFRQKPNGWKRSRATEDFWALRHISFDVAEGEAVGIIGRNGAGKSTLLKILSRITEPTEGRVQLKGRVASLLEVSTGFHPELTGRENVFLNGSILGMKRAEIRKKFDEIVEFAGVGHFIDTPVKRYSSGMSVRLGFAVAAYLESEILVVDEVLAVGDFDFQRKCLGKMNQVAASGRTVLFVSHNMTAVQRLCSRGICLASGKLEQVGCVDSCISYYLESGASGAESRWARPIQEPGPALQITAATVNLQGSQPSHTLFVQTELRTEDSHPSAFIAFDIADATGDVVMQALPTVVPFIGCSNRLHLVDTHIALPPMIPGRYSITIWVGAHNTYTLDVVPACLAFEIVDSPTPNRTFPHSSEHGRIVPQSEYGYRAS